MTVDKFEKFDETGDFRLWRVKMRALLIQHGCEAALEVLLADMEAQAKAKLNKKAHNEFSKIVLDLANIEVNFKDEDLALLLLTSLPASYEHFVYTLLYGREALTLEDVMATLNSKEIKERDSRQSRGKSRSKSRGRRLKCYICQSEDHLKRNCPKNNHKKSLGYVNKDDQPSSGGSIYDGSEVMMVMSVEALLDWIMDSGGSYHMTPRLDLFSDFLECDGGRVLLGDNRECKIRGIGKSGQIKVINGSRIVLSGTRRDNYVYSLDGHAVAGELNASVEEKDSLAQVWHKRLGHISEAGLQVLENQGLFGQKSLGKLDFCENCVLGKSHRVSFVVERNTTQGVIDYVHSDLWGPSQVESLGGKRYFLYIVDDYSRRVWVYIFRFKHEAFEKFKEWKQLIENQTRRTVKKLRTDNGLEFCNRKFKQVCIESGIARHLTVAGTPQQNGLAERADKSVEELQVEVELQRLNNHTLEEAQIDNEHQTDQDDGDDEDAGDQEIDQPPVLTNYQLAVSCEDSFKWKAAMKEEMDSLRKNKTWKLVDHQAGQKLVTCKWLFKINEGIVGVQKPRYKARLVARGFTQRADDMLIACKSEAEIGSTKSLLKREFDMKDLGEAKKILGMGIVKDRSHKILKVSQSGMSKVPYANAVGSLMYLMVCTRPDIAYAVSIVSRYLAYPGKSHWEAMKWILKYMRGTANVGLIYGTNHDNHMDVTCFVDSDYAEDPDKEAEYIALTESVKEAIWLKGFLEELSVELNRVTVNCDNQGAIHLSRNHVFHERTKHINVRYHFIREVLEAKTVEVLKVGTEYNAADALTNVVPGHKLQHYLELLSVCIG
nr:hypothetical protein [Tanacetum cinerariifolium]